jgi:hypothetical protein
VGTRVGLSGYCGSYSLSCGWRIEEARISDARTTSKDARFDEPDMVTPRKSD